MLTALFDSLERLTIMAGSPAPESVADALWLASQLRLTAPDSVRPTSLKSPPGERTDGRGAQQPTGINASRTDLVTRPSAEPQVPLVAEKSGRGSKDRLQSLRIPGAPALPHALALSRALRPLRRRVPSKFQFLLDEEATAECVADQGRWHPMLRPAAERWLDLAIVIDAGPSMEVWRATTQELRRLLERQGFARDVRSWRLDTTFAGRIRLLSAAGGGSARGPEEVSDVSGRRLVVIVSDCVSPAWWGSTVAELVRRWSRDQPVLLVQMLPQRLWGQTSLGTTTVVPVRAPRAASPGKTLVRMARRGTRRGRGAEKSSSARLFVPVTTLEPEFVKVWSLFLASPAGGLGPAVALGALRSPESAAQPDLPPSLAVERFQARASPLTFQLACLFAAAPLRLPVMRLVQQSMLPTSGQAHLAEFLASGLILRQPADKQDPEQALFDFKPGIRDALLDAGTFATHIEVQRRVSEFIAPRFGQALDFDAYIGNPDSLAAAKADADAIPFATVSAAVLRRLGGNYRDAAERFLFGEGPQIRPHENQQIRTDTNQPHVSPSEITFEPIVKIFSAGTRLSRVIAKQYADALGGSGAPSRFSDPAPDRTLSKRWQPLYVAGTLAACLQELFLLRLAEEKRDVLKPMDDAALARFDWIVIEAVRPLRLVDMREPVLNSYGAPISAVMAPDGETSRDVAAACFMRPENFDGIIYSPSLVSVGELLVLFAERTRDALSVVNRSDLRSKSDELRSALAEL